MSARRTTAELIACSETRIDRNRARLREAQACDCYACVHAAGVLRDMLAADETLLSAMRAGHPAPEADFDDLIARAAAVLDCERAP